MTMRIAAAAQHVTLCLPRLCVTQGVDHREVPGCGDGGEEA